MLVNALYQPRNDNFVVYWDVGADGRWMARDIQWFGHWQNHHPLSVSNYFIVTPWGYLPFIATPRQ